MNTSEMLKALATLSEEKLKVEAIQNKMVDILETNGFDLETVDIPENWDLGFGIESLATVTPKEALAKISELDVYYLQVGNYKCFKVEETNEIYFVSDTEVLIAEDTFLLI